MAVFIFCTIILTELVSPGLAIKLLRYYARFIVVSLLLNNKPMARTLLDELAAAIDEYKRLFRSNDITEWQSVIQEISSFIEVLLGRNIQAVIAHRLRQCLLRRRII